MPHDTSSLSDSPLAAPRSATRSATEAYEAPSLTVLGTLAELTRGTVAGTSTDGTFTGSLFH